MTAAFVAALTATTLSSPLAAKSPGQEHCYGDICRRVMTLGQTSARLGKVERLLASYYGDCQSDAHNPCGLTSSGEVFRANEPDNVASAIHPDGTILLLRNPATSLAAAVRVNNFGPFSGGRLLDVSRATAAKLGFLQRGVARLEVMIVYSPSASEARFKRRRKYAPVAGFLGPARTMEHALVSHVAAELARAPLERPSVIARQLAMALRQGASAVAPSSSQGIGQPLVLPRRPAVSPRVARALLASLDVEAALARGALAFPRSPHETTITRLSAAVPLPRMKPARTVIGDLPGRPTNAIVAGVGQMPEQVALAIMRERPRQPLPRRPTYLPFARLALLRLASPAR